MESHPQLTDDDRGERDAAAAPSDTLSPAWKVMLGTLAGEPNLELPAGQGRRHAAAPERTARQAEAAARRNRPGRRGSAWSWATSKAHHQGDRDD